jgi:hypothetical protein
MKLRSRSSLWQARLGYRVPRQWLCRGRDELHQDNDPVPGRAFVGREVRFCSIPTILLIRPDLRYAYFGDLEGILVQNGGLTQLGQAYQSA